MELTTPKPSIDVEAHLPTLESLKSTTVRLHPRRAEVSDVTASKIGGMILWPKCEPWPMCESVEPPSWWELDWPIPDDRLDDISVPLVPVIQLRADDFPEIEFFPETNLLQLLWCPLDHEDPIFVAKPYLYWRKMEEVTELLLEAPHVYYPGLFIRSVRGEYFRGGKCTGWLGIGGWADRPLSPWGLAIVG